MREKEELKDFLFVFYLSKLEKVAASNDKRKIGGMNEGCISI